LDHGWQVRSEARQHIQKLPSAYLRRLHYDCVTNSEAGLRFLLDHVGADRVVLGSDWPFVAWHPSPVAWVQGLRSLTQEEKNRIQAGGRVSEVGSHGRQGVGACGVSGAGASRTARVTYREWAEWLGGAPRVVLKLTRHRLNDLVL